MDLPKMIENNGTLWECAKTPGESALNRSTVDMNATCSNASVLTKLQATRSKGEHVYFYLVKKKLKVSCLRLKIKFFNLCIARVHAQQTTDCQ